MMVDQIPDYLVLGHITADVLADGQIVAGGTALYAALTAHRLGLKTAILTACAPELDLDWLPPAIAVVRQAVPCSTTFRNVYAGNRRTQYLDAQAPALSLASLPHTWQAAPLVHLGPVAQEVPFVAHRFAAAQVGATPQGWLRHWDQAGQVGLDPERLLALDWRGVSLAIVSEEDIEEREDLVLALAAQLPLVVLTRAERGATLWQAGRRIDVGAFPARVVDPTGAGDVFAAACLVGLHYGLGAAQAVRWGCAAAACAIEGFGTTTLPDLERLRRRVGS